VTHAPHVKHVKTDAWRSSKGSFPAKGEYREAGRGFFERQKNSACEYTTPPYTPVKKRGGVCLAGF